MGAGAHIAASRWLPSQLVGTITRSVWRWQLLLAFSAVSVAVAVALLSPATFGRWRFTLGLTLIVSATAASLVIPWARYSRNTVLILPFADLVAVGVMAENGTSFGYLWLFPLVWISTHYGMATIATALGLIVTLQLVTTFGQGSSAARALDVLIMLLAQCFLAVTLAVNSQRTRAFRHLLQRQSLQLDGAMRRVTANDARTSQLIDSLSIAIARVDTDGQIVATNEAYRRLYSYSDSDHRHPAAAVEYSGYRGEALRADQTSLARAARGERVGRERLWIFDANGDWRAIALSIRDNDRDVAGGSGSIIELNDETATLEFQREQRAQASAISHELRNPLTAVLGHADLLLDRDTLSHTDREHVVVIESAAERMLTLIRGLLADRPTEDATAAPFDLGEVVRATAEAFTPSAAFAGQHLSCMVEPELFVSGDAFRLRQVIDNLVSNAIKYTPRGGEIVLVAHADDDHVRIEVGDSGIGISSDDITRVFGPYFRAQTALDAGAGGTGLGMGITRAIISDHGGEITIESELGHGTVVRVTLPRARPRDRHPGAES